MKEAKKEGTAWSRWYAKNKLEHAAKRKTQYDTDPEYRARVLAHAQATRQRNPRVRAQEIDPKWVYTLHEAAEKLALDVSTLRTWRKKGYYPPPALIAGTYRFTEEQFEGLATIKEFFDSHGSRAGAKSTEFSQIIALIAVNWQE